MYRALALCFALGLAPAVAEDAAAPILDDIPASCDGACPETTLTALSSDLDGDGAAEYFDIEDTDGELAVAKADCHSDLPLDKGAVCSMPIDDLPAATGQQL